MSKKKRRIETIKEKIKVFKKDEQGSDILITLLMIAFALVLLALLLLYFMDTMNDVKKQTKEFFSWSIIFSTLVTLLNCTI